MDNIDDFNKIIVDLIELLENLIKIEESKLNAVTENNLSKLDKCMTEEQACMMHLRGLDKKREQIQSSLGYEKLAFSEIISQLPPEQKNKFKVLYDELLSKTKEFKSISESVKTSIEVNLHCIDSILDKLKNSNKELSKNDIGKSSISTKLV